MNNKTKRTIIKVLAVIVIIIGVAFLFNALDTTHSKVRGIIVVSDEQGVVIQIGADYYEFYGDGFKKGDEVIVTLYSTDHFETRKGISVVDCTKILHN